MGRFADRLGAVHETSFVRAGTQNKLVEQLFQTFEHACDLEELDLARNLLGVVDAFLSAQSLKLDGVEQPYADRLIQAHFRLLELRYHY